MEDLRDFLGKIDWEGSIDDALDCGLKTDGYTLPDDIKRAWDALVKLHGEYRDKRREPLAVIVAAFSGDEAGGYGGGD